MRVKGQTRPARTFWWDRDPATEPDVLRAVIIDADSALFDRDDGSAGPTDLVMSLFVAGVGVAVVSIRHRAVVETAVRHLIGDGLVETIVTVDDLAECAGAHDAELYRLALWELGVTPGAALAITGSRRGLRAADRADLPAIVVGTAGLHVTGAAEVRPGYCGPDPLLAAGCRRVHRRWGIEQLAA